VRPKDNAHQLRAMRVRAQTYVLQRARGALWPSGASRNSPLARQPVAYLHPGVALRCQATPRAIIPHNFGRRVLGSHQLDGVARLRSGAPRDQAAWRNEDLVSPGSTPAEG
jgi:hypothetical protein